MTFEPCGCGDPDCVRCFPLPSPPIPARVEPDDYDDDSYQWED